MNKLKTFHVGITWTDFDEVIIKATTSKKAKAEALERFRNDLDCGTVKLEYCRKAKKK